MQETDYTEDTIWTDVVRIRQPRKGYRFSVDSVLLAHFIDIRPGEQALEIGSGSGVVSLLLAALHSDIRITALEVQPRLAEFCRYNVRMNRAKNIQVVEADAAAFCSKSGQRCYDLMFSNPPYRKRGSGKLNPDLEKAIARHELKMQMEDLFVCASNLLKENGRLTVILPEFRFQDFDRLREAYGMRFTKLRKVLSFHGQSPAFFLATAGRHAAERLDFPDLVLYDAPGAYTKEAASLLKKK